MRRDAQVSGPGARASGSLAGDPLTGRRDLGWVVLRGSALLLTALAPESSAALACAARAHLERSQAGSTRGWRSVSDLDSRP